MIKKILIQYAKHGEYCWDASTPELEEKAMWAMFNLNFDDNCYSYIPDFYMEIFIEAKNGDYDSLKLFLDYRSDYEYELWDTQLLMKT